MPVLSAVVPVFNEEDGIAELHRRLSDALGTLGLTYEIVLVNDGSRDRSPELLDAVAAADPAVTVVHLSRNFGHQAAVAAGLASTAGECVVVLDADLQDPPEAIPALVEQWRAGYHIVYGHRVKRVSDPLSKRLLAWMYYRVVRNLADVDVPADAGDFCLMDRAVVDVLNAMPERNRYIRGLRAWVGFRQTAVPFERAARFAGERKYTFRHSLALALNGIFSLSRAPLQLATWLGVGISVVSFVLAAWYVVRKLTVGFPVQGWASIVVIVLFLGGVQLITIGVLGEYLGRVYDEVKQRPQYLIGRVSKQGSPRREGSRSPG